MIEPSAPWRSVDLHSKPGPQPPGLQIAAQMPPCSLMQAEPGPHSASLLHSKVQNPSSHLEKQSRSPRHGAPKPAPGPNPALSSSPHALSTETTATASTIHDVRMTSSPNPDSNR